MSISYAGVYLPTPTPANLARIEAALDPQTVYDWERTLPVQLEQFPGGVTPTAASLARVESFLGIQVNHPYASHSGERPLRIGSLFWPVGASRWAIGRFIVDDQKLAQIRAVVYAGSSGYQAATFRMDDGTGRTALETSLYMLTPRPIWQPPEGENGLWLLTLVDDRWFWHRRSGTVTVTEGVTTWEQLYAAIASILTISLTVETVDPDYGLPTREIVSRYESLPELLDAVAFSVGQRIVRAYSGAVTAQNPDSARNTVNSNLQQAYPVHAGGLFAVST